MDKRLISFGSANTTPCKHRPRIRIWCREQSFRNDTRIQGGSVAEWLACWTRAQKGLCSNCSRDAVG